MIVRLGLDRLDPVLALYHGAFEEALRDPDDEVVEDLRGLSRGRRTYNFDGLLVGGRLAGFVRWRRLDAVPSTFIVHLAVDPAFRKNGFGDQLLAWPRVCHPDLPLLFEVEHVDPHSATECQEECARRLAWFAKRGAKLVSPDYTQPALNPDTSEQPLNLLAIGDLPESAKEVVRRFYRDVWGLEPDHPFVVRALAGVVE